MALHVVRAQGQLLKQLVRYALMPSGITEFIGAEGVLEFKPGEREVGVALLAVRDGVPEVRAWSSLSIDLNIIYICICYKKTLRVFLCVCVCIQLDETFSVVLSSHSTPPSRLGNHRQVNITVRKNDDPFGVIEFIRSGLTVAINESKGDEIHRGTLK